MVAVCNWLNAPDWVTIGLPVVICGGAAVTWVVRRDREHIARAGAVAG